MRYIPCTKCARDIDQTQEICFGLGKEIVLCSECYGKKATPKPPKPSLDWAKVKT